MLHELNEPRLVYDYHQEYLTLINFYQNVKRQGTFVKYYNIDFEDTAHDENLEGNYDFYQHTNTIFNLYDLTPCYYVAPVVNSPMNVNDLRGQMMDGTSSISIYTITRPRHNDLVIFYGPIKSGEIFRVSNFRTPVNAVHSTPEVNWFEVELEYAPITDISFIQIRDHFVYDLANERYMEYKQYKEYLEHLNRIKGFLQQFYSHYNEYQDYYRVGLIIPILINELIISVKKNFQNKYVRLFEEFPYPYGYLDFRNHQLYYEDLQYSEGNQVIYNLQTQEYEEYFWSLNSSDTSPLKSVYDLGYQLFLELSS